MKTVEELKALRKQVGKVILARRHFDAFRDARSSSHHLKKARARWDEEIGKLELMMGTPDQTEIIELRKRINRMENRFVTIGLMIDEELGR